MSYFFQQLATAAEEEQALDEKVDIDIQSLSVKAQWKLVKQESPELKDLIKDFKVSLYILSIGNMNSKIPSVFVLHEISTSCGLKRD